MKSQPLSEKKLSQHRETIDRVERAIAELRRGKPVILAGEKKYIVQAIEGATPKETKAIFGANVQLVVSGSRIGEKSKSYQMEIPVTQAGLKQAAVLAGLEPGTLPTKKWKKTNLDAALLLMKQAELLPAALVTEAKKKANLTIVLEKDIVTYEEAVAYTLQEVCRAPLTLKDAKKAEIIGFRPASGGKEHYAIILGKGLSLKNPLIRVHSSCYTGDLLASLACDCRDQLHEAIHFMNEEGGGIVLYLMQEGRGIGLINKLRTYQLQAGGMDTVEANRSLGFDDDERPFLPAAEILKRLGVKSVRLLTNNPRKVKELEHFGIRVAERVPHVMHAHEHREKYLSTKSARLGHLMPR